MMAAILSASRSNAGMSAAESSSDSEAEKEAAETARLISARAPVHHSRVRGNAGVDLLHRTMHLSASQEAVLVLMVVSLIEDSRTT
jgi:hypothetical protein